MALDDVASLHTFSFRNGGAMKLSEIKINRALELYDYGRPAEKVAFHSGFDAGARAVMKEAEKLADALREYQSYSEMNNYPEHEVRHTLCCEVPQLSIEALARWTKFKESNDEPG